MHRFLALIWVLIICLALAFVAGRLTSGQGISSDISALLPEGAGTESYAAATGMGQAASKRVVLAVGHADAESAQQLLSQLGQRLEKAGLLEHSTSDGKGDHRALAGILFKHRLSLLSVKDRAALETGKSGEIVQRAMAEIFAPLGGAGGDILQRDPLLLFPRYLREMERRSGLSGGRLTQSSLVGDELNYAIGAYTISGQAYSEAFQASFVSSLAEVERDLFGGEGANSEAVLLRTGAVFFAAEAIRSGRLEATLFGSVSIIGILLALMLTFRSIWPVAHSLTVIGAGLAGGLASVLLVFDQVHLMALVFGAGIIGIAVDYAVHYSAQRFAAAATSTLTRLRHIRTPLALGMISSVAGFAIFLWPDFSALRQIAVLSGSGLIAAFLTVMLVLPCIDRAKPAELAPMFGRMAAWLRRPVEGIRTPMLSGITFAIFAAGAATWWLAPINDDIRSMQRLHPDLVHQQSRISALTGFRDTPQFLLIRGQGMEERLQVEEQIRDGLDNAVAAGHLGGYQALSGIIPSVRRQQENLELTRGPVFENAVGRLQAQLSEGVSYESAADTPVTVDLLRQAGFDEMVQPFTAVDTPFNIIPLSGPLDEKEVGAVATAHPGVEFVDPVALWNYGLATYRVKAMGVIGAAIALIFLLLSLRYRPANAARILAAPVLAVLGAPVLIVLGGEALSFFHVMALLLVLLIGLDFTLFFREAGEAAVTTAQFANGLSAFSTLMAFGVMAFSANTALQAFGMTIGIGITLAYLLSPLAGRGEQG